MYSLYSQRRNKMGQSRVLKLPIKPTATLLKKNCVSHETLIGGFQKTRLVKQLSAK